MTATSKLRVIDGGKGLDEARHATFRAFDARVAEIAAELRQLGATARIDLGIDGPRDHIADAADSLKLARLAIKKEAFR